MKIMFVRNNKVLLSLKSWNRLIGRQKVTTTNNNSIAVFGAPFWYGQSKFGTNEAPDYLRSQGLIYKLKKITKIPIVDYGNLNFDLKNEQKIINNNDDSNGPHRLVFSRMSREISDTVERLVLSDSIPLMLGGDHSCAFGSVLGSANAARRRGQKLSVIWIDAHADCNTPSGSLSGHLHGMPVSYLFNRQKIFGATSDEEVVLDAKNFVFIGLRDVEPQELQLLMELGIVYFSMADVDRLGINEVIKRSVELVDPNGTNPLHISFDVDVVDPLWIPSTGTPVSGGLTVRESLRIAEFLFQTNRLSAIDIVELNPRIGTKNDVDNSTKITIEIILAFFGKSPLGYFPSSGFNK